MHLLSTKKRQDTSNSFSRVFSEVTFCHIRQKIFNLCVHKRLTQKRGGRSSLPQTTGTVTTTTSARGRSGAWCAGTAASTRWSGAAAPCRAPAWATPCPAAATPSTSVTPASSTQVGPSHRDTTLVRYPLIVFENRHHGYYVQIVCEPLLCILCCLCMPAVHFYTHI